MGKGMKQHFTSWRAASLAIALLADITTGCPHPAGAADMEEDPAAAVRLSQKASRNCTESCMSECRADRVDCKEQKNDDENSCRVEFQMCVRRCVVTCSPK
jgi:hypothetical protein